MKTSNIFFVADESVERSIVSRLRDSYDVIYIAETNPGITDERVLSVCRSHKAVLITADKDFGELVFRFRQYHYGVILYRLAGLAAKDKADFLYNAINKYLDEINDNFTIITKDRIRIRKPYKP